MFISKRRMLFFFENDWKEFLLEGESDSELNGTYFFGSLFSEILYTIYILGSYTYFIKLKSSINLWQFDCNRVISPLICDKLERLVLFLISLAWKRIINYSFYVILNIHSEIIVGSAERITKGSFFCCGTGVKKKREGK